MQPTVGPFLDRAKHRKSAVFRCYVQSMRSYSCRRQKKTPPKRGQVDPHHKDWKVSIGVVMDGAPVAAFGDAVLVSNQDSAPVHESLKDRRGRMIASLSALRPTDADRAMPVEPDRQIDCLKTGLAIDDSERHTHAVRFQIAVALVGQPSPVQNIATLAPLAHVAPPEPRARCAVFGYLRHGNSSP